MLSKERETHPGLGPSSFISQKVRLGAVSCVQDFKETGGTASKLSRNRCHIVSAPQGLAGLTIQPLEWQMRICCSFRCC